MCIVYLQLELEAWRSGCGRQQSGEHRDSENPHPAKESSKEKLKLKIVSKLVQYYFISIYAHLYVLYISMSCPFYLSLLKADWKPFYSHMALERLKYSIVWAQHPF